MPIIYTCVAFSLSWPLILERFFRNCVIKFAAYDTVSISWMWAEWHHHASRIMKAELVTCSLNFQPQEQVEAEKRETEAGMCDDWRQWNLYWMVTFPGTADSCSCRHDSTSFVTPGTVNSFTALSWLHNWELKKERSFNLSYSSYCQK